MKRKIPIILLVVLVAAVFAACNANQAPPNLNTYIIGNPDEATVAAPVVSTKPVEAKDNEVTIEKYEQITEGMTYDEVVAIIGGEGRAGKKRGTATPYQWTGFAPMSKTITMNFNDEGKLVSKDPQGSNYAAASSTTVKITNGS